MKKQKKGKYVNQREKEGIQKGQNKKTKETKEAE